MIATPILTRSLIPIATLISLQSACVEPSALVNVELVPSAPTQPSDAGDNRARSVQDEQSDQDDASTPLPPELRPLSPTVPVAGRPRSEWIRDWLIWHISMDGCDTNPFLDPVGSLCAMHQEHVDSQVFFLEAGEYPTRRAQCVVPRDKQLLVPLVYAIVDSVVPAFARAKPPEDLAARARELMDSMRDLVLEIDGHRVLDVARFGAEPQPLTIPIHAPPNYYGCLGFDDVQGPIDVAVAGYFVTLPALAPGAHELRYAGTVSQDGFDDVFGVVATLTVP